MDPARYQMSGGDTIVHRKGLQKSNHGEEEHGCLREGEGRREARK